MHSQDKKNDLEFYHEIILTMETLITKIPELSFQAVKTLEELDLLRIEIKNKLDTTDYENSHRGVRDNYEAGPL